MELIKYLVIRLDEEDRLRSMVAKQLGWPENRIGSIRFLKRSIDARRKAEIKIIYSLQVYAHDETPPATPVPEDYAREINSYDKPRGSAVIIGAGPAGLFAALEFRRRGWEVDLIERGSPLPDRHRSTSAYFKRGELNPDDNVCFGLGGAGLYSDGKLTTRIKHKEVGEVLAALTAFGAPEQILWTFNPHVGSNKIRQVIRAMTHNLEQFGVRFHFHTRATGLLIEDGRAVGVRVLRLDGRETTDLLRADSIMVACGHGAVDTYRWLRECGAAVEPKPFAVGLRVEHPREFIDRSQFGNQFDHPALESASYRLTCNLKQLERGVYTFCMCPGGYVLPAATEPGSIVVNGMSNFRRGSRWSNSAIVVTVDSRDWGTDPFAPIQFRRQLEERAFDLARAAGATGEVPASLLSTYRGRGNAVVPAKTGCLSGAVNAEIREVFPTAIAEAIDAGLDRFDQMIKGFSSHGQAVLYAVESRTSAPIRLLRDPDTFESISIPGLVPVGEGSGYAGGITSAAVDGLRAARAVAQAARSTKTDPAG
jgi:uncharacterized protein